MRARPIVWLALAVAAFSLLFAHIQINTLPDEPLSGEMTAMIAEVSDDRLLLTDVVLEGEPLEGNVLLYSEPCGCAMQPGMLVELNAQLEPLQAPVNPHGWDDRTWYVYKNAVYTCDGALTAHSAYAVPALRSEVRRVVLAHTDALWGESDEGGVIHALLFGNEDGVSEETQEAFRRSGAAHLMAVSGLHVGFVAALVLFAFSWMRRRSIWQLIAVFFCMGLYALVAESAFSVFRAILMLAAGLLAGCFGRKADGATSLAAAALIALIADPLEILRAGFLMSVCAVAGIFMLGSRLDALLKKVIRIQWLRGSVVVSVAAQLGVMPVQLAVFGTFNVLSLVTNLFAVPLAAGIVMIGLPTVLLHMIWSAAAVVPGAVVGFLAKVLTLLCDAVSSISFAQVTMSAPPLFVLLGFMGLLFLLSPYFAEYGKRARIAWAAGILAAFAAGLALWLPAELSKEDAKAVFLSVGTADSTVLQSEDGCVLIDTGWSGSQAVRYAQGEKIGFDAVILTHADGDHAGGLERVLRDTAVGTVLVPKGMSFEGMEEALAVAKEKDIAIQELSTGDSLRVGAYEIEVLSPRFVREDRENEDSLVLCVSCEDTTLLMTSDITEAEEEALSLPECDILKVPHHGSATATSDILLDKAAPADAVISVGTPNRYGFPREEVMTRLEAANVRIWRTDEQNAVIVTFGEDGYEVQGYEVPTVWEEWFGYKDVRGS